MSRRKRTEIENFSAWCRSGARERFFLKVRAALSSVAGFYGFEPIHSVPFIEGRIMAVLNKENLLEEPPVFYKTRFGEEYALNPAAVFSALQAFVIMKMDELPQPQKIIFEGDRFSYGAARDQKLKGGSEFGLLMIGEEGPVAEAEVIQSLWKACVDAGIRLDDIKLRLNAVGCAGCRSAFRVPFSAYFRGRAAKLCGQCRRFLKRTPTRILHCVEEKCRMAARGAPQVLDYVCDQCKKHLRQLLEFLDEAHIPYFLDACLFRESSLFGRIVFEIITSKKKSGGDGIEIDAAAENSSPSDVQDPAVIIAEGGRISSVAEIFYGKPLEAVCGSIIFSGAECALSRDLTRGGKDTKRQRVFLVQLGELARRKSLGIMELLRAGSIEVRESLGRDSIKSQLKVAERVGTKIAMILGQKEALDGTIIIREVQSGIQETIQQDKLVEFLKQKLKK